MINIALLRAVAEHDGLIAAAIIRPFLKEYCDDTLRWQLRELEKADYIHLDRSIPGRVICRITEKGRKALREAVQCDKP